MFSNIHNSQSYGQTDRQTERIAIASTRLIASHGKTYYHTLQNSQSYSIKQSKPVSVSLLARISQADVCIIRGV